MPPGVRPTTSVAIAEMTSDIHALSAMAWQLLTGKAPLAGAETLSNEVAELLLRGLKAGDSERWHATEMLYALERDVPLATPEEVGAWVARVGARELALRDAVLTAAAQDAIGDGPSSYLRPRLATGPFSPPRGRMATLIGVAPSGAALPEVVEPVLESGVVKRPSKRKMSPIVSVMLVLMSFAAVFALAWTLAKLT